jgi:hypothetical protein
MIGIKDIQVQVAYLPISKINHKRVQQRILAKQKSVKVWRSSCSRKRDL